MRKIYLFAAFALASAFAAAPANAILISAGTDGDNSNDAIAFDFVVGATAVELDSFDFQLEAGITPLSFYYRSGTHVGNVGSLAGWTLHQSIANLSSGGSGGLTSWDINNLFLGANTTTAFLFDSESAPNLLYYNGTGVGNVVASDANVSILEGTGLSSPLPGGTFTPRYFSGNINYELSAGEVPLPGTLPLLAIGFIGMGVARSRRKAKNK